jgi:DNA invertase Pin-like site-specific DNA recombinase
MVMKYSEAKQVLERQDAAKAVLAKYEKLASSHEALGFRSRRELITALQEIEAAERGKGRVGRGLSPQVIDQIQKLKAEGKKNTEIARITGVSPLTVGKYVKAQGGKAAPAKPAKIRKPAAKKK